MTKAIMTDELRAKKAEAGRLGAARTNALKAEKKAQGEFDHQTRLERNREFNRKLDIDIAALRVHCNTLPQFVEGTTEPIDYDTWIDSASDLLRDCTWDKPPKPLHIFTEYDLNGELAAYEHRQYGDFQFPAFACRQLLRTYHHFSPEMIQFLIRTIEAFLPWAERYQDTLDLEDKKVFIPAIKAGLQRLQNNQDFYREDVVERIQEEYKLKQQRLQHEREEEQRIRNLKHVPAPEFVPAPPPDDPLVVAARLAKLQAEERARLEEDNRLRQLNPDAWNYLRGGR